MKKSLMLLVSFTVIFQKVSGELFYGCDWPENCAWQIGASFVDANPDARKDDIRRFCADEYPIIDLNGRYEIEMHLQTACILGGTQRLEEIDEEE